MNNAIYTRIDNKLKKRIKKLCKEKYNSDTICHYVRMAVEKKVEDDEKEIIK